MSCRVALVLLAVAWPVSALKQLVNVIQLMRAAQDLAAHDARTG